MTPGGSPSPAEPPRPPGPRRRPCEGPAMALIEGVGDEVTLLFGLLALLLLLGLAWLSTHTVERAHAAWALLAPERPRHDGPSGQPAGATLGPAAEEEEEEEPAGGAAPDRPASPSGGLRHRASLASAQPGGPGALAADDAIPLRLKFLNDTERLARVRPDDTVGSLKRAQFPGQEQLVRLIYQGQWLRDDSQPLRALHLAPHSVLHCHLLPPRAPPAAAPGPAASAASSSAALNVGGLLVPLLALLLGALWYLQLQHRHVFTATATACLAGLTLLATLVAFAVYRR